MDDDESVYSEESEKEKPNNYLDNINNRSIITIAPPTI